MDVTNIDGANGNEAPGWINDPDIYQEVDEAIRDEVYKKFGAVHMNGGFCLAQAAFSVLRRRGLLTSQALELLQRDGDLTPLR